MWAASSSALRPAYNRQVEEGGISLFLPADYDSDWDLHPDFPGSPVCKWQTTGLLVNPMTYWEASPPWPSWLLASTTAFSPMKEEPFLVSTSFHSKFLRLNFFQLLAELAWEGRPGIRCYKAVGTREEAPGLGWHQRRLPKTFHKVKIKFLKIVSTMI